MTDSSDRCPSPELIAGYVVGEVDLRTKRHTLAHLCLCHECMREVLALRDIEAQLSGDGSEVFA